MRKIYHHIALFLFSLVLTLVTVRALAQPIDTVWIAPCLFNELQVEGIDSIPEVWYRIPQDVVYRASDVEVQPLIDSLDEIGKTIAPEPIPDFALMVISIGPSTVCGIGRKSIIQLMQLKIAYRINTEPENLNRTLMETVLDLHQKIRASRQNRSRIEAYIIPINSSQTTESSI